MSYLCKISEKITDIILVFVEHSSSASYSSIGTISFTLKQDIDKKYAS
jgi:hypothetical protein